MSVQATVNGTEEKVNNYVAYIEDTGYTSLAEAVAAANKAASPVTITIVASGEYDAFTLDAQNNDFTIVADEGVDVTVNVSAETPLDLYDGYASQTSSFTFQNINFVSEDGSTIVTTHYFGKDNRKFTFDHCTFANESGDPTGSIALYIDYPNVTIQNCEFTNWETGYYTAGEGYTMGTMDINGNQYRNVKTIVNGYWQHPVDNNSKLTISSNTIDPGDWGNAAIVLWDWGQYQAWLDGTTSVSTAIRAVVSDNTMVSGTMEYHKIHCDWFVPSDITLPENAEIINYYLIELDGDDITSCQVYDQNGNLVATLRNAAGKQYIYNLPEGDYTFQVTQERENGDNVVTTQTVTVAEPPEGTDTQVLRMQDISQVKVAKVGDVEYTTLADAIAAAGPGDIVKLLSSVEIGETLKIDRPITIDGNGFEIVAKDCAAIYVAKDLESLTVQNLTLTGKSSDDSYVASENMDAPYMGLGNYHATDPKGIGRIVLTDVEISGFDYGLYFGCKGLGEKTVSIDADRLNIHDCYIKGAYFEKLTDSTFTDSDFVDNGSNPNLVSDNYKKWMCGVDINLKYGEYENITFEGCTFIGNGSNDGTALHIKARDDGASYGGNNAASLDGVTITGCTFADNNQPNNADTPIVLGEPNANNKTPVNVSIQPDVAFVNNLDRSSTVAVTFKSNGGSSIATQIVGYGEKVDEPADPSRPGYVFEGWYKDNGLTTPWDFAMGTVTSPTTLYAKWSVYIPPVPSYLITLNDSDNGTITSDRTTARQGTTVTLTVSPDDGYAVNTVTVTDFFGNRVEVSRNSDGTYSFLMPYSQVTVSVTFAAEDPVVFTDVPAGEWYYNAVYWAVENGVTDGTSDTLFSPGRDVTRAEMVTFLWRAAGSPEPTTTVNPFEDVSSSAYYYDAVLWAVENGITDGVSDTEFDPDGKCTRAQMVTFLWRAENEPDVGTSNPFEDVDEEEYYYEAILWAAANGITDGMTDTTFVPGGNCTRAQAVTFLYRTMV